MSIHMSLVKEYFVLNEEHEDVLRELKPEFGYDGFGEAVFWRTYSRRKPRNSQESSIPEVDRNGILQWTGQENWCDVVLRNTNGVFTIRKDWYLKTGIKWDEEYWQDYALGFAEYLHNMYWLPPGRGLWAMGTKFVYDRGSMALNNCAFTYLGGNNRFADDCEWFMDCLMMGVGVGFEALRDGLKAHYPAGQYISYIEDTRESWAQSVRLLIEAFIVPGTRFPKFVYDRIRRRGLPIRGFGGLSSGPEPLMKLHTEIVACFERYLSDSSYDIIQLKTDIANMIGCCVVAGNVRRSAELAMGSIRDQKFMDLKDYIIHPERESYGWMSNNTVRCEDDSDFDLLGEVAKRVPIRGEPGVANLRNFSTGRIGKKNKGLRKDKGRGLNPCGEIILEDKELCNLSETIPTCCPDVETWYKACEYATFYSSTVSLLPTHWANTNEVVARNRRIGVGIIDYTGWIKRDGLYKVTKYMRHGYKIVTETNKWANGQAGVPEAIRKTTIKPGGTVPKLPGRTSGAMYPTFEFMLRRIRVAANNPVVDILRSASIPCETDIWDANTLIFAFPVKSQGAKPADKATLWEQANNLVTLQREWADNSVSNTLYFRPKWVLSEDCHADIDITRWLLMPENKEYKLEPTTNIEGKIIRLKVYKYNSNHEEDDIEPVLSSILPVIKACSLLPHSPQGVYHQMPEEGITEEEYLKLKNIIRPIDWSSFSGSDGEDERYCQGPSCEIPSR